MDANAAANTDTSTYIPNKNQSSLLLGDTLLLYSLSTCMLLLVFYFLNVGISDQILPMERIMRIFNEAAIGCLISEHFFFSPSFKH